MGLPWHQAQWRAVAQALRAGRLPQAWLIHGGAGLGKRRFARQLAQVALCQQVQIHTHSLAPCGTCASCRQFGAGVHPDFVELHPLEDARDIKIDQVRYLIERLQLSKHHGLRKLALIDPAEALTRNAADAMLKTLEEPPPDTHLLLVTERMGLLSPTIRSRCQRLSFGRPDTQSALAWLEQQSIAEPQAHLAAAEGAPLRAAALAADDSLRQRQLWEEQLAAVLKRQADVVQVAEEWGRQASREWLNWLERSCREALAGKLGAGGGATPLAGLPWRRLLGLSDRLSDMYKVQNTPVRWPWQIQAMLVELLAPA